MNEHELSHNLENILVGADATHLKAIIIVVVGTLQIPNQYKIIDAGFFLFFPSQIENSNFGIFF